MTVREAVTAEDLDACFAVRRAVFVEEQRVSEEIEYDAFDTDGSALHVLAVARGGNPIGAGRLLHGPGAVERTGGDLTAGALGRLAVLPRGRGLGVGGLLVRGIEDAARDLGLKRVELHAQTHALGFYTRLGYEAYGPEFVDAGIAHRAMHRPI